MIKKYSGDILCWKIAAQLSPVSRDEVLRLLMGRDIYTAMRSTWGCNPCRLFGGSTRPVFEPVFVRCAGCWLHLALGTGPREQGMEGKEAKQGRGRAFPVRRAGRTPRGRHQRRTQWQEGRTRRRPAPRGGGGRRNGTSGRALPGLRGGPSAGSTGRGWRLSQSERRRSGGGAAAGWAGRGCGAAAVSPAARADR